jgi:serine protease inhibitor
MHDFEHIINLNITSNGIEQSDFPSESFENTKPESFIIDHPFVFIIYEKYSEGILCIGKISNI